MLKNLHSPLGLSLVFAGLIFLWPEQTLAGFQWVAPSQDAVPQTEEKQHEELSVSSPVIIQGQPVLRAPSNSGLETQNKAPLPEKSLEKEMIAVDKSSHVLMPPGAYKDSGENKTIQGFANNVPLAVALRQILPPEYGFSVAQDVQLNTLVSWQGGRPWRQILEDMLRGKGLGMREQGKMVSIVKLSKEEQSKQGVAPSYLPQNAPAAGVVSESAPSSASPHFLPAQPVPITTQQNLVYQNAPSPQIAAVDSWSANRGDTLRKVLESWSRKAGVDLSWQAEYDYPVHASITLTGTFEEAVRGLLMGFQEAQPQPVASLYNNPAAGQAVLVVKVRGNNYND